MTASGRAANVAKSRGAAAPASRLTAALAAGPAGRATKSGFLWPKFEVAGPSRLRRAFANLGAAGRRPSEPGSDAGVRPSGLPAEWLSESMPPRLGHRAGFGYGP